MKCLSKFFSSLLPFVLSSGCVGYFPPPVAPPYPFKVGNYFAFVDDQPGSYDVITIGDNTYCYFWKKTEDEDDLFIYDKNCDLHSDRVIVLSGIKIMVAADTKDLKTEVVQNLDYILQNHEKHIIKNTDIIIF